MRVLLISPLPGIDPPTGDVSYTQALLRYPPPGVEYTTYEQALERGLLIEHATRRALAAAFRSRRGRVREAMLLAATAPINFLRRRRVLFLEPFRLFSIQSGAFDLVHLHVFSAGFRRLDCPLVVSNAAPLRSLYRAGRLYSAARTRTLEAIDLAVGRLLRVNVNSYRVPQASRIIAFTDFLAAWYADRGVAPDKIDVVPAYLPLPPPRPTSDRPRRIGFVSKAFAPKGGLTVLEAFTEVRRHHPDASLLIVGADRSQYAGPLPGGVDWISYVDRDRLLTEILPTIDVFAYPTGFDGLPIILLEAMSLGIAVAGSDYEAIPEMLDSGRAGMVSPVGDAAALAKNVLELMRPDVNRRYSARARARFMDAYSSNAIAPRLAASYKAAIEAR